MKNLLFAASIAFLLVSCGGQASYSVLITNNSDKDATFDYNDETDTIEAHQDKTYDVKAYTQPPKNIVDQNGIASIKLYTDGMTGNYSFTGADFYTLSVINMLPEDITIQADNFIDNNGEKELLIEKYEKATAKIYTNKPDFTTDSGFSVVFDYNYDEPESTIFLTIR